MAAAKSGKRSRDHKKYWEIELLPCGKKDGIEVAYMMSGPTGKGVYMLGPKKVLAEFDEYLRDLQRKAGD